jgi:predicted oxidoreductase
VIAESLMELAGKLGLDAQAQETLLKSIERYNEVCRKGRDEDFGKVAKRLFPIATPPFYAARISAGPMLICMGGLTCNPETGNVLDRNYKSIEGLYAAGNTMGGRFVVDYPVVAAGASHGFALTYGRLVGTTVASL